MMRWQTRGKADVRRHGVGRRVQLIPVTWAIKGVAVRTRASMGLSLCVGAWRGKLTKNRPG